jgi:hypothetical protein
MAANPNKLVLVDTNCLMRIYFSPLRPILSRPVAGYELKTLDGLARELRNLAQREDLAWLSDQVILAEVDAAVVPLTQLQRNAIVGDASGIQKVGNAELHKDFVARGLRVCRTLSFADAKALAACLELNATLSSDEWPLRLVAGLYDYDDGKPVELLSSLELIELLERENLISREERVKTYTDWLRNGEALLRESPEIYFRLFNEEPPTAQG